MYLFCSMVSKLFLQSAMLKTGGLGIYVVVSGLSVAVVGTSWAKLEEMQAKTTAAYLSKSKQEHHHQLLRHDLTNS